MIKNKKLMIGLSFCLGAAMFATTAFADIASKTGYDQFKRTIKSSAESMSSKFQSYTLDTNMVLKDNGKLLISHSSVEKSDRTKEMVERLSSSEAIGGKKDSSIYYSDGKSDIWNSSENDIYYVTEYPDGRKLPGFQNPFEEDRARDMERIFDAAVGSLRDYVVVEEKPDGSKEFSGSLSEAQIPALVNAVSSFLFKQAFSENDPMGQDSEFPKLIDDVSIRKVTGKAEANKDGILESLFATGVLSGKDKDGVQHDLTLELLVKVSGINSTTVTKPNLEGKKVEKNTSRAKGERTVSAKFIGKYKNDIVIEKNEGFVKIGERFVEIVHVDEKNVSGKYYEQYKDGYSEYESGIKDFTFDAELKEYNNAEFDYTDASGEKQKGYISFDEMFGKFYFNLNSARNQTIDPSFYRVFDN